MEVGQGDRNVVQSRRPAAYSSDGAQSYEAALLQCAAGKKSAISDIYLTEVRRMRAVAQRIVRDRDHADDVIHEAFVQILRDAKSFDPARGSARAWIYTIVRHTALKCRHTASREVTVGEEGLQSIVEQQDQPCDPGARIAEGADLRACLEGVDPRRRASLILAIIDGGTHAEIADYLGVPVGTVKAWIRRELISLREKLK